MNVDEYWFVVSGLQSRSTRTGGGQDQLTARDNGSSRADWLRPSPRSLRNGLSEMNIQCVVAGFMKGEADFMKTNVDVVLRVGEK